MVQTARPNKDPRPAKPDTGLRSSTIGHRTTSFEAKTNGDTSNTAENDDHPKMSLTIRPFLIFPFSKKLPLAPPTHQDQSCCEHSSINQHILKPGNSLIKPKNSLSTKKKNASTGVEIVSTDPKNNLIMCHVLVIQNSNNVDHKCPCAKTFHARVFLNTIPLKFITLSTFEGC